MQQERLHLDCLGPACLLALMLLAGSTSTALTQCPRPISCLLDRRSPCIPGTQDCGPCLVKYQEDPGGKCIPRKFWTHVPKERPKVADTERIIDFLGNLLKSQKSTWPAGLKSSRVGSRIYEETLKTPPDGPKKGLEGPRISVEGLKATFEQLKIPAEGQKATSDGIKTDLEGGERTYLEGPKLPTKEARILASANTTDEQPTRTSTVLTTPFSPTPAHAMMRLPENITPARQEGAVKEPRKERQKNLNDAVSLTLVVICTITGVSGLLVAALCWYRLQKEVRLAQKMAYTAYRGSRQFPAERPGDDRLAQSVQVHHYQHQKKQLQNLEENGLKAQQQLSTESEADNDAGEYTVYECPGLAPTGEMEIHNPLFFDSSSSLHAAPGCPSLGLK